LINASLEKNTVGAIGVNQIMRFGKKDLKFTQHYSLGTQQTANF